MRFMPSAAAWSHARANAAVATPPPQCAECTQYPAQHVATGKGRMEPSVIWPVKRPSSSMAAVAAWPSASAERDRRSIARKARGELARSQSSGPVGSTARRISRSASRAARHSSESERRMGRSRTIPARVTNRCERISMT